MSTASTAKLSAQEVLAATARWQKELRHAIKWRDLQKTLKTAFIIMEWQKRLGGQ